MSAPNLHPPIPRQPIGLTFIVSIAVLGAVAAIQLLAVIWHYIPLVNQQIAEASAQSRLQQREEQQQAQQTAPQQSLTPAFTPAPLAPQTGQPRNAADRQKVEQLIEESARNFRVGEYEAALKPLDEVEEISPGDPAALALKYQIFEQLGQPHDAVLALDELLRFPGLSPQARAGLERKLNQLQQLADSAPPSTRSNSKFSGNGMADASGVGLRGENGLPAGSSLGIVTVRMDEGKKPGTKNLLVAVKSAPGMSINVQDVKIYVYFYEQTADGETVITDSKVVSQWISPPTDWAANEPELLQNTYTLPGEAGTDGSRQYVGYVVAVYYNKELQDFRADPSKLARDFEVPLYLKESPTE